MSGWAIWVAEHLLATLVMLVIGVCAAALGLWTFIRQAPTPEGRQRRRKRVFIAVLGAQAVMVVLLALNVGQDGALTRMDKMLAGALAAQADPAILQAMALVTRLGDRDGLLVLGGIVLAVLLLRKRRWLAAEWTLATGGSGLMILFLKQQFARVRPEHIHGFETAHGWSFPSGHAAGSTAVYGMLCYLAMRKAPPQWRPVILIASVMLIITIGLSRVVLQVHFLSDVLAGFACASLWLAACVAASAALRGRIAPR
ncbi:phosphatase PAP2 family protein [Pigmentiphaga aceris]|nr:phosphatase PAP2 family protein [Pigmentiphaga aceris]